MDINELYDTENNAFIVLLNQYISLIISDHKKYKEREFDLKRWTSKYKMKNIKSGEQLVENINSLFSKLNESKLDWFNLLYDYGCFLRYAEKIIMYKNDPEYNVICSENNKKDIFLLIKNSNFKSKISISKTDIPDINTGEKLDLFNVEIVREFGKKMMNEFKFISGEEPKFNNESDRILFEGYQIVINRMIIENFSKILDSVGLYYLNENIGWKGYLNNGFWVRK